jgi:hypothetical protein
MIAGEMFTLLGLQIPPMLKLKKSLEAGCEMRRRKDLN